MPEGGGCHACPLSLSRTREVAPTSCPPGGLLCIGEAPGEAEDLAGEGFVGAAGRRLSQLMESHGFRRGYDYGVANICRCRPPKNRKPTAAEQAACLPRLAEAITAMQPSVLLLVGGVPSDAFFGKGHLWEHILASARQTGIDSGRCHPALRQVALRNVAVIPMPHTSGLAWNRKSPAGMDNEPWRAIGARQVQLAVSLVSQRSPVFSGN